MKTVMRRIAGFTRRLLRKFFPRLYHLYEKALLRYTLWRNYRYDYVRYLKHGGVQKGDERITLQSLITMDYHRLEKGLSLRSPRSDFGTAAADELLLNLTRYCKRYGVDSTVTVAIKALQEYIQFRARNSQPMDGICSRVEQLAKKCVPLEGNCNGGTIEVNRDSIQSLAASGGEGFFSSRHSIRDFTEEIVSIASITEAVRLALRTPSVCNRQAWQVHAVLDGKLKDQILDIQNGNRGFRSQITCLLIVTCDLRRFVSVGERNQAFVDGGMFSMSLIYALHSLGLGSCCLNWSVTMDTDKALRQRFEISLHEIVVVMIAVGHMPERFRVACSHRSSVDDVLLINK